MLIKNVSAPLMKQSYPNVSPVGHHLIVIAANERSCRSGTALRVLFLDVVQISPFFLVADRTIGRARVGGHSGDESSGLFHGLGPQGRHFAFLDMIRL